MNAPQIRRIDAAFSFVDTLASWLLQQRKDDPLALAQTLILLPSRRACRNLREAFLRQSEGAPLLLPRILPLGELDGEWDLAAFTGDNPEPQKPVMPQRKRLALLTRMIMQAEKRPPSSAYQLASDLARLLDEATRYGIGFDNLEQLVDIENLATHWQKTTEFLKLITHHWPRILEAEGMIDEATYVQQQLHGMAAHWRANPPAFPIIAAGSTGHVPATAELLLTIASLPQGMVIVPGLDSAMPQQEWDMLEPTHPQFGLKQFLGKAGITRQQVDALVQDAPDAQALRAIFAPAALTAHWRESEFSLEPVAHITLLEAATQADEARMIAYHLRTTLDTPRQTAGFITPDRVLARMVASECARYGITVDDSAGFPLSDSPPAVFLRLLMDAATSGMAPESLLALLRHPLAANGTSTARCRDFSRVLELRFLRGVRLAQGMDALLEEIAKEAKLPDGFAEFMQRLRQHLRPLELLFANNQPCLFADMIDACCAAAEALATTDETSGATLLWCKEAGQQVAAQLAEWKMQAQHIGAMHPKDMPAFFSALLEDCVLRRPYGQHPRIHILSPVESRLASFDKVILGEMSEGTWPAGLGVDPWMSAPMRERFGLPAHALTIGQSAQDIWMLLPAKEVILTRARKIMSSPAEPSRWWVRLTTLVGGKDPALLARMDKSAQMQATIDALNAPDSMEPLSRPAPLPPREAAARKLSVSAIDLWKKDAYAFYARYILKLRELDTLDAEPDAADFGNIMHKAFELFSCAHPNAFPQHAYQLLLLEGEKIFRDYANRPAVKNLWWPRFEAIARHWLAREEALRHLPYDTRCEVSATWNMQVAGEEISLTARADRIDSIGGKARLIDYKTGSIPKRKDVIEAKAQQLPLTALALHYDGKLDALPETLIYWGLKTRPRKDDFVEVEAPANLFEDTATMLFAFIEDALSGTLEYPANIKADDSPGAKAYRHLSRHSEWISN